MAGGDCLRPPRGPRCGRRGWATAPQGRRRPAGPLPAV